MQYKYVGKIDKNKIVKYSNNICDTRVILTLERLNEHILQKHLKEYKELENFLELIIEKPDIIIEDNKKKDTLIFLKNIEKIKIKGRIVVKMATQNDKLHPKNSIITIMKLNDRTWNQTINNRGKIIYKNVDNKE